MWLTYFFAILLLNAAYTLADYVPIDVDVEYELPQQYPSHSPSVPYGLASELLEIMKNNDVAALAGLVTSQGNCGLMVMDGGTFQCSLSLIQTAS